MSWKELKPMVISHLNHYFEKTDDPILKEKSLMKKIIRRR